MWLTPLLSPLSRLATRAFYRFRVDGPPPPRHGPVLLLANHPNALLDPAMIAASARRPVRFLAKSTLFDSPWIGWFFEACGAIPVYRRLDDPAQVDRNVDTFEAVFDALKQGDAVGIFPEGISHSQPSLATLKTGAARIALGFHQRYGRTFTMIPMGIVLRNKTAFRSGAAAVLGEPVDWEDLAPRGVEDREAVRQLTERIDVELRGVTVNLERWEDRPLVEFTEAVWSAQSPADGRPSATTRRIESTTAILSRVRRLPGTRWSGLAKRVADHQRRLRRLGLKPRDLLSRADWITSLRWTWRRLYLVLPPLIAIAAVEHLFFWVPYGLTDLAARSAPRVEEVKATYKLLLGFLFLGVWVLLAAGLVWWLAGPWWALGTLVALPVLGGLGRRIRERWRGAWSDVRRFFRLRTRPELVRQLRMEQEAIFEEFEALVADWKRGELGDQAGGANASTST